MAVPTYDEFFLPLLSLLAERHQVSFGEAKDLLAERMGISDEDRDQLLPSGRQRRYDNRVGWARTYLTKAGLVRSVQRGVYELTESGKQFMSGNPSSVTVESLMVFAPFREWREAYKGATSASAGTAAAPVTAPEAETGTPEGLCCKNREA